MALCVLLLFCTLSHTPLTYSRPHTKGDQQAQDANRNDLRINDGRVKTSDDKGSTACQDDQMLEGDRLQWEKNF